LDKMKIAGGEKMSSNAMYTFDRDMENTSDEVTAAEDVTSENP
jgi:ferritin